MHERFSLAWQQPPAAAHTLGRHGQLYSLEPQRTWSMHPCGWALRAGTSLRHVDHLPNNTIGWISIWPCMAASGAAVLEFGAPLKPSTAGANFSDLGYISRLYRMQCSASLQGQHFLSFLFGVDISVLPTVLSSRYLRWMTASQFWRAACNAGSFHPSLERRQSYHRHAFVEHLCARLRHCSVGPRIILWRPRHSCEI